MGYDVYLVNAKSKKEVKVPTHQEGSVYAVGGSTKASMCITSNYHDLFCSSLDKKGIRWLNGKTGREVAPILAIAVCELGQNRNKNYWEATPGNAGHMLNVLLSWACLHPTAIFQVEN